MDTVRPPDVTTRIPSATFESLAVARGLVTPAQVDECRALHQTILDMGLTSTIQEVLLKKGYLTAVQVAAVESALGKCSTVTIPGYEIVEKIAEGGMGAVYKARQTSMDRFVAIKVLLPKFANEKDGRERFVREARAVAKLSHPNVVAGIDAGEAHGLFYFVMEFIDGEPMDQTMRRRGRLPWGEAVRVVRQMALALEHAHEHGIVHRDVKPGNILLLKGDKVKLADLGLARMTSSTDATLTQSGMMIGSPAYVSPEQAMGDREVDIRSDIFSLGLTFFEFVAGERAYAGSNPMSILTALLMRDVPVDKLAAVEAPKDVAAVIAKMTQRDPVYRYQTPKLLLEDLDAILGGVPVVHAYAAESRTPDVENAGASTGKYPSSTDAQMTTRPAPKPRMPWILRTSAAAVAILIVVALVMWPSAVRQTPAPQPTSAARPVSTNAVTVALTEAIEKALARAGDGIAYHAELERDEYSIDLARDKMTLNYVIDATNGDVVDEHEEDEDHSDDVRELKMTLSDAVNAALKSVPGTAVEAEIRLPPGRRVFEVKVLRDGNPVWVEVNSETGDVERSGPKKLD